MDSFTLSLNEAEHKLRVANGELCDARQRVSEAEADVRKYVALVEAIRDILAEKTGVKK